MSTVTDPRTETTKWYRVDSYAKQIKTVAVEVVKETADFIFVQLDSGAVRREKKITEWFRHYKTEREALEAEHERTLRKIQSAKESVEYHETLLDAVRAKLEDLE